MSPPPKKKNYSDDLCLFFCINPSSIIATLSGLQKCVKFWLVDTCHVLCHVEFSPLPFVVHVLLLFPALLSGYFVWLNPLHALVYKTLLFLSAEKCSIVPTACVCYVYFIQYCYNVKTQSFTCFRVLHSFIFLQNHVLKI